MDAVQYLKEKGRFCKQYKGCSQCPLYEHSNCVCPDSINPAEAVRIVEKWSNEHPIQTNAQKFEEVFGITLGTFWNMGYREADNFVGAPYEPPTATKAADWEGDTVWE